MGTEPESVSVGHDQSILDTLDDPTLVTDPAGMITYWNRAAETLFGILRADAIGRSALELLGASWGDPGTVGARVAEAQAQLAASGEWRTEIEHVMASGSPKVVRVAMRSIRGPTGVSAFVATLRDITDRRKIEHDRDLLAAAVDQAADSVVITDATGCIVYVNPAFEEVLGYSRAEVLGRNPRMFKSGAQSPEFYRRMWGHLTKGEVFRAEFENRRKDGSIVREMAVISPVRGPDGTVGNYVAVRRDVTRKRAEESQMAQEARQRSAAFAAISTMRPGPTAEDTAAAIAWAMVEHCAFAQASIFSFEADDQVIVLANIEPANHGSETPRVVDAQRSRAIVARAETGPWSETAGTMLAAHQRETGMGALIFAPIILGPEVVGLVAAGAAAADADALALRLPFLVELARMSSGLIGPALDARRATAATRLRIQKVLDDRAFRPVFQPLVDLTTRTVVGYEILTRFADQTPPDVVFAVAHRCGLGLDLEERTIEAAFEAAGTLPANVVLHVNVSPALIMEEERLRRLLGRWGWNVVLEVTEHEPILDYEAIRNALHRISPEIKLAVDDAGAGFASFRHILELRPAVVKLDRSLVTAIDGDLTRQALVAGMVHFAGATGFELLAEGVETEGERATLIELGVTHGQGWLFGRPQDAPEAPAQATTVDAAAGIGPRPAARRHVVRRTPTRTRNALSPVAKTSVTDGTAAHSRLGLTFSID